MVACTETAGPVPDAGPEASIGSSEEDIDAEANEDGDTWSACDGNLPWPSSACESCMGGSCCDLQALCKAEPECLALRTCWTACDGDLACEGACGHTYQAAISNYNAVLNCRANFCSAACESE